MTGSRPGYPAGAQRRRSFLKRADGPIVAGVESTASLKETRLEQGLRLTDVAKRAGCSISVVSMTESGYKPSVQLRSAMAQAVGASLGSFWPQDSP